MRIHRAKTNSGFSRPQVLLLACLCLLAFEGGMRYAEKKAKAKVITRTITTNTIVTNVLVKQVTPPEPPREVVTNFPPLTISNTVAQPAPRVLPPATNVYAKRPAGPGGSKEWVQPEPMKGVYDGGKRKVTFTNAVVIPGAVGGGNQAGIRIVIP